MFMCLDNFGAHSKKKKRTNTYPRSLTRPLSIDRNYCIAPML